MSESKLNPNRRRFLLGAGIASAGLAVGAVAKAAPQARPVEAAPASPGYRETEHIRNYYKTARL